MIFFVKPGWDRLQLRAVERGRAGWAMFPDISREPVFLAKAILRRFPSGRARAPTVRSGEAEADPASQFPSRLRQFVKQSVRAGPPPTRRLSARLPRWWTACALACCFHRRQGSSVQRVAQARPEKVKALIGSSRGIGDPNRPRCSIHRDAGRLRRQYRARLALAADQEEGWIS